MEERGGAGWPTRLPCRAQVRFVGRGGRDGRAAPRSIRRVDTACPTMRDGTLSPLNESSDLIRDGSLGLPLGMRTD